MSGARGGVLRRHGAAVLAGNAVDDRQGRPGGVHADHLAGESTNGPPELPLLIAASVRIKPVS